MRSIPTDDIRAFFENAGGDLQKGAALLLERCAALDLTPENFGFEFLAEGDRNFSREGVRQMYYVYKLDDAHKPDDFTADVYIVAPDNGADEDSEIVGYYGMLFDDRGGNFADSSSDPWFTTTAECVAWLNERVSGWIHRLPEEKPRADAPRV